MNRDVLFRRMWVIDNRPLSVAQIACIFYAVSAEVIYVNLCGAQDVPCVRGMEK
ncbi:MAG: hypothetical protein ACUVQ6_00885 [Dissulfurimicrobium sp.]|uniref:hypothetical protein n=1 Tax=Dissulfurimicrobium sp. TaxID=2022436 RepID=UPI004049059A